jgi:alkanesulfonate monooxygenase SsuD/methylene tetrahydromethanopterin reductase-like flavin-dependent oxidoreductase (luciferase family)
MAPAPPPRVGLLLPQYHCSIEDTLATARAADVEALDIWIAGQVFPISERPEGPAFEPLALMGALTAATQTSRLGFMVLAAPYLPAIYLAKSLITLDHLSQGRIDVGLGAGWREEEFRALGVPFGSGAARRARLEHAIDAIETLAAGEPAAAGDGSGEIFASGPESVQRPHPPLWIAGKGERVLEVVGRRADWANFARGISVDEFASAGATVKRAAEAAGRTDGGPQLSLTGTFLGGKDSAEAADALERRAALKNKTPDEYRAQLRAANAFAGDPDEIAEQLGAYVSAGCRAVVLWPVDGEHERAPATLAAVAAALTK